MKAAVPQLGVNVDHVATVRQARRTFEPDPVTAAAMATLAGADVITIHLREDRRHILDRDVRIMRETVCSKLNLEMAVSDEIVAIALDVKPEQVTLVPEKREEVTTEGGLGVLGARERLEDVIGGFRAADICVSLFIDAHPEQIAASAEVGADFVELHTGPYANAQVDDERRRQLDILIRAEEVCAAVGVGMNAGHGLTYQNTGPLLAAIRPVELHIGHSIISRAVLVGIERAVREMKEIIHRAAGRSVGA